MTVTFRGMTACTCLAAWIPVFEDMIGRKLHWYQLVGDAPASAGFHRGGGSGDTKPLSTAELRTARNMGAAAWNRWWKNNNHAHLRLNGCPHNTVAQPQVADLNEGRDGTGPLYDSAGVPDNGPRAGVHWPLRTWRDGIAWAKAQQAADIDYVELGQKARDRYLARRKKKGQLRPLPLRRTQANGMGATAKPERTAAIVRAAAAGVDLLTLCEVANIDVATVLGDEWDVAQDRSTPAKAGVAVAVRKNRGRILDKRIKLGVPARLGRRRAVQMRNRYVMVATIRFDEHDARRTWQDKTAATHGPPKRNWNPWWGVWVRALRTVEAHDIGADFNRNKAVVQRVFLRRIIRMRGIDGFVLRPFIPSTPVTTRDVGGDHTAKDTVLWPTTKEIR